MKTPRKYPAVWIIIFLALFAGLSTGLTACSSIQPTQEVYIPPTLASSPVPLLSPTATPLPPSPAPTCTNYLRFIADATIPDGTVVAPGDELDKRWQVENAGTCNWDARYSLRLITGPDMGASRIQSLFPARSGTTFELRIVYTAPEESGIYRSAWQAFDPQDQAFGDPIFIEIVVP